MRQNTEMNTFLNIFFEYFGLNAFLLEVAELTFFAFNSSLSVRIEMLK